MARGDLFVLLLLLSESSICSSSCCGCTRARSGRRTPRVKSGCPISLTAACDWLPATAVQLLRGGGWFGDKVDEFPEDFDYGDEGSTKAPVRIPPPLPPPAAPDDEEPPEYQPRERRSSPTLDDLSRGSIRPARHVLQEEAPELLQGDVPVEPVEPGVAARVAAPLHRPAPPTRRRAQEHHQQQQQQQQRQLAQEEEQQARRRTQLQPVHDGDESALEAVLLRPVIAWVVGIATGGLASLLWPGLFGRGGGANGAAAAAAHHNTGAVVAELEERLAAVDAERVRLAAAAREMRSARRHDADAAAERLRSLQPDPMTTSPAHMHTHHHQCPSTKFTLPRGAQREAERATAAAQAAEAGAEGRAREAAASALVVGRREGAEEARAEAAAQIGRLQQQLQRAEDELGALRAAAGEAAARAEAEVLQRLELDMAAREALVTELERECAALQCTAKCQRNSGCPPLLPRLHGGDADLSPAHRYAPPSLTPPPRRHRRRRCRCHRQGELVTLQREVMRLRKEGEDAAAARKRDRVALREEMEARLAAEREHQRERAEEKLAEIRRSLLLRRQRTEEQEAGGGSSGGGGRGAGARSGGGGRAERPPPRSSGRSSRAGGGSGGARDR
ncbi:hypothetical protein JKP88DRAFT_266589 [Tribonema minus]|uniref:Uncharacterized protein n=1 Tax=Tribonema minus TaxID=303371 RepID=A0A836CQ01_9STRA|nr:hypothetical protein JKP88DRAFT_266589 [Tribonema minus]